MASIEMQPNGGWKARYRDANGPSRRQTFTRKQDAQSLLDDLSNGSQAG